MQLRYPWLRLGFFGLVALCRSPLGRIAHDSRDFELRLRAEAESMVEDALEEGEALVGAWCYDLEEVKHVRRVTERLHAVLGGDWSRGALRGSDDPAWDRLAEAAKAAYIAFAQRGLPSHDFDAARLPNV